MRMLWTLFKVIIGLAIAALQRSVQRDSTNPISLYHLGLAYSKHGDWAQARQSLERALRLKPDFDGSSDARTVLASIPR